MWASERWRLSDEVGAGKWGRREEPSLGKQNREVKARDLGELEKGQIFQDLSK